MQKDTMPCDRCGAQCGADDLVELDNRELCEDCYMDVVSPLKACDPWAVHSAKQAKLTTEVHLLPIQQQMVETITNKKAITPVALAEELAVGLKELQKNFAILRHMELLRGFKGEDGVIYWTLFAS